MATMSTTALPEGRAYPAELKDLLERAGAGDADALPALRRAFDESPGLAALRGDLAPPGEQAPRARAGGETRAAREAVARQAAALRDELGGAGCPPLERLLVRRISLCW